MKKEYNDRGSVWGSPSERELLWTDRDQKS